MTFEDPVGLIILVVGLAILLFLLSSIVHIVREYERLVVFFFGRLQGGARAGHRVPHPIRAAGGQGRPA